MKASTSILIVVLLLALVIFPLIFVNGAEFGGADGEAEGAITEINPDYTPWFSSFFEPASGEIESLLFASQAALGAGIICYTLGYMKGKKKSAADR